jgi:hypothetical protein
MAGGVVVAVLPLAPGWSAGPGDELDETRQAAVSPDPSVAAEVG